jgi:hypothetical protein
MPFCSLSDLKSILRIPAGDTSRNTELQLYVDAANAHLYGIFGISDSGPTSYTDRITVREDDVSDVWTRRWPVISVSSVTCAGVALSATAHTVSDTGLIQLLGQFSIFPVGVESVVVTYSAGFSPGDPALAELRLAALQIAAFNANTSPKIGLGGERIGQYSYTQGSSAAGGNLGEGAFGIPPAAERALAKWTRGMQVWPNDT